MIEYLRYRGRTLRFSTPQARALKRILSVDSFTLLIGENGSGKTSMLVDAAALLTQGSRLGEQGSYGWLDAGGQSQELDTRSPPAGYGAVYFTALPYRRPLRRSRRLINASPARSGSEHRSMELLRSIAASLGFKARLFAQVGYRADFARELLLPAVFNEPVLFNDPHLQARFEALRRVPYADMLILGRARAANGRSEAMSAVDEARQEIDAFAQALAQHVYALLDQRGSFYRVAALASLQLACERHGRPEHLALFFLHDCGIVHDERHWSRGGGTLVALRDATMRYLSNENGDLSRIDPHAPERIAFEVSTDTQYGRLRMSDTAIRLDWDSGLSSGMMAVLEQFARLDGAIGTLAQRGLRKILLLIDEGDAFLHLEWQRRYIDMLDRFLGERARAHGVESLQVVLATHSPILAGDLPASMVQSLDRASLPFNTFGATLDDIVLRSFHSNSIGEFAARHIRRLHAAALEGRLDETDRLLIEQIGDPVLKREVAAAGSARHDR